jgi:hypothetical protein
VIERNTKIFQEGDKKHLASDKSTTFSPTSSNGLIGTILSAYNFHLPLVLRPDDIWVNIMLTFGNYVIDHSEEMRECFVDHEGRKELTVTVQSPYLEFTTEAHWASFLNVWEEEMDKHVKGDLSAWMIPNFTTTTRRDQAVSRMVMMGAMKEYFSYTTMLCCGLSEVTLMGSLKDWQDLQERVRGLYKFNQEHLTKWADALIPVLGQFIGAYQGEVEESFWQRVATSQTYGSGGQRSYTGWLLVFNPFVKGKCILNTPEKIVETNNYGSLSEDEISISHISFQMTIDDYGTKHLSNFHAGMLLTEYDEETQTVQPSVDMAIYLTQELTMEDMKVALSEKFEISERRSGISEEEKAKQVEFLKFAYFVADKSQFNIPNDTLRDWAGKVNTFFQGYISGDYSNPEAKLPGKGAIAQMEGAKLYKQFLLCVVGEFFPDGTNFKKYVVKSRIDEVVQNYLDQL